MKLALTLFVAALSLAGCVDDVPSGGYGTGIQPAKPFNSNPRPGPKLTGIFAETIEGNLPGLCDDCEVVIARHEPQADGLEIVELERDDGTPICSIVVDDSGIIEDGCGGHLVY